MKKNFGILSLGLVFTLLSSSSVVAYEGNPDIIIHGAKNRFLARGCKDKPGYWCVIKGGHPNVPETITVEGL